jgi:glucokinase
MRLMILAGDIGGTHTRLAVFDYRRSQTKPVLIRKYPSRDYDSLDAIVRFFVGEEKMPIDGACFGVAGPVKHGRSETSNLAWVVDSRQLASELSLESVQLLNDLEASAYGIVLVEPQDIVVLNEGVPVEMSIAALISAGTGLGEAGLHWEGGYYRPFPSEGGHADFAPRNELETELLLNLLKQYDHVSYERVLSGPGLYNIYKFLRDTGRGDEPAWLTDKMGQEDPSSVITQAALQGTSDLCVRSLDLFVSIYGAEAGNLALKFLATGGVFVGGGIAPKIIEKLRDSTFMKAFKAKGRLSTLLEAMPVRVILNDQTALLGAARFAAMKMGI